MEINGQGDKKDVVEAKGIKHLLIVAGEASGDLHAGRLVKELKQLVPVDRITGIAGRYMREAGVDALSRVEDIAVMGFTEVLGRLGALLRAFRNVLKAVKKRKPDLAILVDAPDLNLRLAKKLHRKGVPVVYYISPQVWAWRTGRVRKITRFVDKMLVILPFEKDFYARFGVNASFVGHPLLDRPVPANAEARASLDVPSCSKVVALLPGSRIGEIKRILPVMISAAYKITEQMEDPVTFLLPVAGTIDPDRIEHMCAGVDLDLHILTDDSMKVLAAADVAAVASGTATLEAALAGTPMVIVYKTSWPSYLIARALVRGVDYIGLPNLILGRRAAPELIQGVANSGKLAEELLKLITGGEKAVEQESAWKELKEKIGGPGAGSRAAVEVAKVAEAMLIKPGGN
ncbi:MAG: lipid-A-disaccharide synthase [Deltaproteobacteria bacterium]|nr:lipid-A-disaccharide synthase [Deltaproteobacteria bacterium]